LPLRHAERPDTPNYEAEIDAAVARAGASLASTPMRPIPMRSDNRPDMPEKVLPITDRISALLAGVDHDVAHHASLTARYRLNQETNHGRNCRALSEAIPVATSDTRAEQDLAEVITVSAPSLSLQSCRRLRPGRCRSTLFQTRAERLRVCRCDS
jgi:hypothetical protein